MIEAHLDTEDRTHIPWLGVRRFARKCLLDLKLVQSELRTKVEQLHRLTTMGAELVVEVKKLRSQRDTLELQIAEFGYMTVAELEARKSELEENILQLTATIASSKQQQEQNVLAHIAKLEAEKRDALAVLGNITAQGDEASARLINTDELSLLQEVGIYRYRHPLTDSIAYQSALSEIEDQIRVMVKKDGGAVLATTNWTVNGSITEGRRMVRDFSKLMLRAYNAEADNLVRGMKPYKLDSALDRLTKVSETIERLGKTMSIRISPAYQVLRTRELQLTADFLQKHAEEKERERAERERLREERKAQQEIEIERARLEKERQHYTNALSTLVASGDQTAAEHLRSQLDEINKAIESVDYRAANIRAGYVYVISNVGSFGAHTIKIGMTRRLDPMDRVRELSDASVPFNFDVHAIFFSNDAVTIETEMHTRLAAVRVNTVNRRREFFHATPAEAKRHLSELTGALLEFNEVAEAIEYRQSLTMQRNTSTNGFHVH